MKLLVVEDKPVVLDAISQIFQPDGAHITGVATVPDAVAEAATGRYDVIILDTAVSGKTGLTLLDEVRVTDPSERSFLRRKRKDPAIVAVRHVGDVIPDDNPLLKGEVMFPFTAESLRTAVAQVLSASSPRRGPVMDDSYTGIVPGRAYLCYHDIRNVAERSAEAGFNIFLVTASRPKVAKERIGVDKNVEVFQLRGNELPLGTMVQAVSDYVQDASAHPKPMVVIDDLDLIFDRCGMDRTLRALSSMINGENKGKFTFMTSVNEDSLSESIKTLLRQLMDVYKAEEYHGKN